jgi:general secretion pathway protein H
LRPRRPGGFTLIEMIVVLAIAVAVMGMVGSMMFRGASTSDLKAAARTLASGLRQAQSAAMVTRRDALLTVDVDAREYYLPNDTRAHKLPEGLDLKLFTAQSEALSEKKGAIRFYPDGSSTGGRITVQAGERRLLVDVDWLTGRVSIND